MAKILEEYVIIKVSKLVKDNVGQGKVLTDEQKALLSESMLAVVNEIVDDGVIAEVAEE